MHIEVPVGDVVDRITILRIKEQRIADPAKVANVRRELASLTATWDASGLVWPEAEAQALQAVNEQLWDIEDALRRHEASGDFGEAFVALARGVYHTNDRRASIKRQISASSDSSLVEEKDYVAY